MEKFYMIQSLNHTKRCQKDNAWTEVADEVGRYMLF